MAEVLGDCIYMIAESHQIRDLKYDRGLNWIRDLTIVIVNPKSCSLTQARHQSFNRNHPKREIVRETLGESHMKKKFGYESKEMYACFFEALEGRENPHTPEDDLHEVMSQIQEFLIACYWMGVNPLRELRKMLPQYQWQFHVSKDKGHIRKTVSNSDLIWRVNWDMDMRDSWSEEIELVTATNLSRPASERPSHFWASVKLDSYKLSQAIAFVEIHDGCAVYYEDSKEES